MAWDEKNRREMFDGEAHGAAPRPAAHSDVRQQASQQRTDSSQTTQVQVIEGTVTFAESIETLKRSWIKRALAATHGSQTKAAQILALPQSNLPRLMKKLGLR